MMYNVVKTIQAAKGTITEKALVPEKMVSLLHGKETGHRKLEGMTTVFSILALIAILVGSIIEIYPTLNIHRYVPTNSEVSPYTSLELLGRDLYIREGCYTCHSQQIRHLDFDVLRFGQPSTVEESMYDRPFQWGSKRTGPDLARVGKKYPDLWHFRHMINPREIVTDSLMPNYYWLAEKNVDFTVLRKRLSVMKMLGVPYSDEEVANAADDAEKAAKVIASGLSEQGAPQGLEKKEIVALIAYLQSLGQKKGAKGVSLSN